MTTTKTVRPPERNNKNCKDHWGKTNKKVGVFIEFIAG